MMKQRFKAAWLAAGLMLTSCEKAVVMDEAEWIERGRQELVPFKKQLMGALQQGMAEGPEHAVQVCQLQASKIVARVSTDVVAVGRSSHKLRNPENAPEPWVEPYLEAYLAGDREPHVVRLDDGVIGYVEPIVMQPLCVTCHGEVVPQGVEAKLAQLYPGDQARGFEVGDFRGAFWVKFLKAEELED